jgi:hypothetical protein
MMLAGVKILTERLPEMNYEEFLEIRRSQSDLRKFLKLRHKPDRKIAQLMPIRQGYNYHPKL